MFVLVLSILAAIGGAQDAGFECAWRTLAYEYGQELLPAQGSFATLFDALELGSQCGRPPPLRKIASIAAISRPVTDSPETKACVFKTVFNP